MSNEKHDPKVDELLVNLAQSREKLHSYIGELEVLRTSISSLFPSSTNFRTSKFGLEDKIKASTSFYSTILSMWQEINKTVVSEVEMRRKIENDIPEDDDVDIRSITAKIDKLMMEKKGNASDVLKVLESGSIQAPITPIELQTNLKGDN